MAQFDISATVNNILSSRGDTAQELVGEVIGTTADLAEMPDLDLAKLPGQGVLTEAPQFNPFDPAAARGAVVMASKLMEIAEQAEGDGLDVAIGTAALLGELVGDSSGLVGVPSGGLGGDLTTAVNAGAQEIAQAIVSEVGAGALGLIGLRQQALTLFITHYPAAHEQIKLKPLDQREPNLVSRAGSRANPEKENRLNFWREDAQLNEHHGRWHDVYPTGGRPTSSSNPERVVANRNGELFVYMHVQMLARYDAERLGVGLPRVAPFDDYRAEILEGYDPGEKVMKSPTNGNDWIRYRARPAGAKLTDLSATENPPAPASMLADQEKFRDALREAARQEYYQIDGKPIAVSSDNLGDTVEASIGSVDWPDKENPFSLENGKNYGNLHGAGHAHFAYYDNRQELPSGVLLDLFVTVRDPIFWRWHKHADTIIQTWRETLGKREPHDFSDGPPVTVRNKDIILCREEGLPAGIDGGKLGAKAFGYSEVATENQWDTDFSSEKKDEKTVTTLLTGKKDEKTVTVTTTAKLFTEMRERTIRPRNPETMEPEDEVIDYLSHDDFSYFIRLQNDSDQVQKVTIRIFLAPERWAEDSTAWIEMDRFRHGLNGRERAVIFRPADLSAVVRKPAIGHKEIEEIEGTKPRYSASIWCDCGWPYNLLLPRGTEEGLDFRLLVMLSSDDLAMDDTGQKCTSMSSCGLQDEMYPDKRPMGYPFDRPLPDSIDSIIDKHDNWASRKIKIRCRKISADPSR